VLLLSTLASFRPVKPTAQWWTTYWDTLGVELEAAVAARGLSRVAHTRNLPKGRISIAAGPLKVQAKQRGREMVQARRQQRMRELGVLDCTAEASSTTAASDGSTGGAAGSKVEGVGQAVDSSSSSDNGAWQPHPLSWLLMMEALQIVTNLQGLAQQSQSQRQQQQQHVECSQQKSAQKQLDKPSQHHHQQQQQQPPPPQQQQQHCDDLDPSLVNGSRTAVLLWACVRLKRMPPKPLLWQLLLLVLADVHSISPSHLSVCLWAVGHMCHRYGRRQVECFKLILPLALAAQWRLLMGLAGDREEHERVRKALGYLASEDGRIMAVLLRAELARGPRKKSVC
jgi:hypothetical protein